ncbi:hypothetical protein ACO2Q3_13120 [Caulobacter sp. KR2-114]|uniref:hypothetical protein n=1 Tax=Caulobacter sp. KR2-114 TaxID=3400912 RepID=UPI003BFE45E2
MPRVAVVAALGLAGCLAACHKMPADTGADAGLFSSPQKPGRYLGVGIYTPGQGWGRLVQAQAEPSAGDARLADDQAIIVVMDSRSGEVRACGDLTGYCIGLNPWAAPLAQSRRTPVTLSGHEGDGDATPADAAPADATPAPTPPSAPAPAAPGR